MIDDAAGFIKHTQSLQTPNPSDLSKHLIFIFIFVYFCGFEILTQSMRSVKCSVALNCLQKMVISLSKKKNPQILFINKSIFHRESQASVKVIIYLRQCSIHMKYLHDLMWVPFVMFCQQFFFLLFKHCGHTLLGLFNWDTIEETVGSWDGQWVSPTLCYFCQLKQ